MIAKFDMLKILNYLWNQLSLLTDRLIGLSVFLISLCTCEAQAKDYF